MWASFMTAVDVVLPIAVMLLCGVILRKTGILNEDLISGMNRIVFRLFLPMLLFWNCYSSDLNAAGAMKMVLFSYCCTILMFLISILVVRKIEKKDSRRSVMLQGMFRGNLALFGVPVLMLLYHGEYMGIMSVLLAFIIPEMNILAVLCFSIFSGHRADWKQILKSIATNPLIIAIVLGIVLNLLPVSLPGFLEESIESLSKVATPLSFVLVGAGFTFASARRNRKALTVMLTAKLLILPLVVITAGILLGLRGPILASAIILFAAPVAVSSVPMATEMGGDVPLASEAVLISHLIGVGTMFLWIFAMSWLGVL